MSASQHSVGFFLDCSGLPVAKFGSMSGGGVSAVVCVLLFKSSEVSLRAPFVRLGAPLPHYSHPLSYRSALHRSGRRDPVQDASKASESTRGTFEGFTEARSVVLIGFRERVVNARNSAFECLVPVGSRLNGDIRGRHHRSICVPLRDEWGAFGRCHDWHWCHHRPINQHQ